MSAKSQGSILQQDVAISLPCEVSQDLAVNMTEALLQEVVAFTVQFHG